jgi:hypothetical protein
VTEQSPAKPFATREPHVLLSRARDLEVWGEMLASRLTREVIQAAVEQVPDDFLSGDRSRLRAAYSAYLWKRLKALAASQTV